MSFAHRLIPLLAAVLLIQGVAAVAPHHHDPSTVVIGGYVGLTALASLDGPHSCLACSVHTPEIEQASLDQSISKTAFVGVFRTIDESLRAERTDGSASPRGPPAVV